MCRDWDRQADQAHYKYVQKRTLHKEQGSVTVTETDTRTNVKHSNVRQLKGTKDTLQLFVQTERSVGEPCHKVTSRMHHVISKGHVHATSG